MITHISHFGKYGKFATEVFEFAQKHAKLLFNRKLLENCDVAEKLKSCQNIVEHLVARFTCRELGDWVRYVRAKCCNLACLEPGQTLFTIHLCPSHI